MPRTAENKILAHASHSDFIGREAALERLLLHPARDRSGGLALLAQPLAGTSELLRQAYDRMFTGGGEIIPFYFRFRTSDNTAYKAARRLVHEFLVQTVAFRRQDQRIVSSSPGMSEVAQLAHPSDGHWIDRIVDVASNGLAEDRGFRDLLSAPIRAADNGARSMVMLDGLHTAANLERGSELVEDLLDIFGRGIVPFAIAGLRRFMFGLTGYETLEIDPLSFAEAGRFIEALSARTGVAINEQTRDLIAVQLGGRPSHITCLFAGAAANAQGLNTFEKVEQAYTDEIFGGRIARHYDSLLNRVLPAADQALLPRLFSESSTSERPVPASYWRKHLHLTGDESENVLKKLNDEEIINFSSDSVSINVDDLVLTDYIRARNRLEVDGQPRAKAVGEVLSENVRRAPKLMARHYRRASAIGLRSLMLAFDGRSVSSALIDYERFKTELKGAGDDKALKAIREDNLTFTLPKIVYTANTAAFYSKLDELCDSERSAVALGFTDSNGRDETVWIAAEIESKLEAGKELAGFWCDRLEMAALSSDFSQFKIWLIAPEGFTPLAISVLKDRGAYGSSRKQVVFLAAILNAKLDSIPATASSDYEIVIPMGENSEMIAAHTVEEITKRHGFPAKEINQIKTALVEACINASEHSLSPDRRIYQKFAVDSDKITITVSNRGLRLADKPSKELSSDQGRRGWGLKLIEGLMDEVRIEDTDDGTCITMVKMTPVRN